VALILILGPNPAQNEEGHFYNKNFLSLSNESVFLLFLNIGYKGKIWQIFHIKAKTSSKF